MSHSYRYRIIYTQKKQWYKHQTWIPKLPISPVTKGICLDKKNPSKSNWSWIFRSKLFKLFLCIRSMHFPFIMCLWITSFYSVKSVLLVTFFRHLHYLLRRQDHILRAESLSLILQSVLHRIHFDNNGSWKVIRSLIDKTDQSIEEYIKE